MKIIFDERCLEFNEPGHPESPERVRRAAEYLRERFDFVEPRPGRRTSCSSTRRG